MPARMPSLEPPSDAVKQAESEQKSRPGRRGSRSLFEGWELGAIVLSVVLSGALVAVPRAAPPVVFPVPLIDVADAQAARERREQLAARAEREGLPFEARAVGDAVRRLGLALAESGDVEHARGLLDERVQIALNAGHVDALERLRAVQARLFTRAVREFAWQGKPPVELAALGGDFVQHARQSGWVDERGCLASDDELQTLFERRWIELTRLREHPRFKPSLADLRRYFRFVLLHPERGPQADERALAATRLRYVNALARYDGEYPANLARGVLFGALGMAPQSAVALSDHLSRPEGTWALRARNHLLFASRELPDGAADSAEE